MDAKHRLLIWRFVQGIFPAREVRSLLTDWDAKRDRGMGDPDRRTRIRVTRANAEIL